MSTQPLLTRLLLAQAGGCTCGTKTPELQYHSELCHYRLFSEAINDLENYIGICNAWKRDYDGEKARGNSWRDDCKEAEKKLDAVARALREDHSRK